MFLNSYSKTPVKSRDVTSDEKVAQSETGLSGSLEERRISSVAKTIGSLDSSYQLFFEEMSAEDSETVQSTFVAEGKLRKELRKLRDGMQYWFSEGQLNNEKEELEKHFSIFPNSGLSLTEQVAKLRVEKYLNLSTTAEKEAYIQQLNSELTNTTIAVFFFKQTADAAIRKIIDSHASRVSRIVDWGSESPFRNWTNRIVKCYTIESILITLRHFLDAMFDDETKTMHFISTLNRRLAVSEIVKGAIACETIWQMRQKVKSKQEIDVNPLQGDFDISKVLKYFSEKIDSYEMVENNDDYYVVEERGGYYN